MRVTIKLDGLDSMLDEQLDEAKRMAQAAMANRFATIVDRNFGFDGEDRPSAWPALSKRYADLAHGGQRIPTLVLAGDLRQSIEIQDTAWDYSEVWTDWPYATEHQFGNEDTNLPARPFFPVLGDNWDGGEAELTPYSEREVLEAAQKAMEKLGHPPSL